MAEALAVLAGALVAVAVLAGAAGPPQFVPGRAPRRVARPVAVLLEREQALAAALGPGAGWQASALLQSLGGFPAGVAVWALTGLPVLALASGVAAAAAVRMALGFRAVARVRRRQDGVLDAVRMLRGLLEAGGVGVQQALAVVAERGPLDLRPEFAAIVAAGTTGDQPAAWAAARDRIRDPLFDMLCAAVLVQRPAGGSLAPLFASLEESISGIHEVAREAEALQVQARSAAALIVVLPLAFLLILSTLRSPYLDAYREPAGAAFLAAMLAVIGLSYVWILRWLRLPEEPRLEMGRG
jgi:Flp pilus assembly protein TadB